VEDLGREPERSSSAVAAISVAEQWFASLDLTVDVTAEQRASGSAVYGRLVRSDGSTCASAAGKGRQADQALASLLYELVEHSVFLRSDGIPTRREWEQGVLRDLTASDLSYLHREATLRTVYSDPGPRVVVELEAAAGPRHLAYPIELTTEVLPRPKLLDAYYGNSGMAAGQTTEEALLHALCEIAERDAQSEFLLRTCVDEVPAFRLVKNPPKTALGVLASVSEASGTPARLAELPSTLGLPCFLAYIDGDYTNGKRPIGLGCSLIASHAMVRAATELLQEIVTIGTFPDAEAEDLAVARHLRPYPFLRTCASLQVLNSPEATSLLPAADANLFTSGSADEASTVEELLREVLRLFELARLDVFWTEATEKQNPVSVVLVVVPGAERFYRIRNGYPIGPIGRHRTPTRLRRCSERLS
jgi:YcaO-like protein with predicted kinase domain